MNINAFLDHSSKNQLIASSEQENDHLLSITGHGSLNSPKRLSLDERLERELGIKVEFLYMY